MKKKIAVVMLSAVLLVILSASAVINRAYNIEPLSDDILNKIDISKAENLMIVAHPDDETLWGGAHLCKDNYLVVCITNASNKKRAQEFEKAMAVSDDQYIQLDYPDKVMGKRDNWKHVNKQLTEDLTKVIDLKDDWDLIVTHNPEGEYGHQHHIMTNNIVTDIYNRKKRNYNLFYYGHYYRKTQKDQIDKLIPERQELLEQKDKMLEQYTSQNYVVEKFRHMLDYEQWDLYITK